MKLQFVCQCFSPQFFLIFVAFFEFFFSLPSLILFFFVHFHSSNRFRFSFRLENTFSSPWMPKHLPKWLSTHRLFYLFFIQKMSIVSIIICFICESFISLWNSSIFFLLLSVVAFVQAFGFGFYQPMFHSSFFAL